MKNSHAKLIKSINVVSVNFPNSGSWKQDQVITNYMNLQTPPLANKEIIKQLRSILNELPEVTFFTNDPAFVELAC